MIEKFDKVFKKVNNELERWTNENSITSIYIKRSINKFEEFIVDTETPILSSLSAYSFWHQVNFIKSHLLGSSFNEEFFSRYMLYKIAAIKFTLGMGQVYPGKNFILMVNVTDAISLAAISRHWKYYSQLSEFFLAYIDSEYMHKGVKNEKHSWFVIQLYCLSTDNKLDTKTLNYPKNLDIYEKALAAWNSEDLKMIDKIIYDICEYHLDNSSQKSSAEFQDISLFVFPLEILCWLSVRKNLGMNNPTTYTHPIMQLNLNKIFEHEISVSEDELLKKMFQSFKTKYPEVKLEV